MSSGVPQGTAYVLDGSRTVAVVRQDGTVETDRSGGFRSDLTVVRVIGRFAFAFLYPSEVCRIKGHCLRSWRQRSAVRALLNECHN